MSKDRNSRPTTKCPLALVLRPQFSEEVRWIMGAYRVGPSIALCNYLCPAILGHWENLPDGTCAIRARLLHKSNSPKKGE